MACPLGSECWALPSLALANRGMWTSDFPASLHLFVCLFVCSSRQPCNISHCPCVGESVRLPIVILYIKLSAASQHTPLPPTCAPEEDGAP
eukprot:2674215-Rhodomonas_salina.1